MSGELAALLRRGLVQLAAGREDGRGGRREGIAPPTPGRPHGRPDNAHPLGVAVDKPHSIARSARGAFNGV